jgi:hypothetical protein
MYREGGNQIRRTAEEGGLAGSFCRSDVLRMAPYDGSVDVEVLMKAAARARIFEAVPANLAVDINKLGCQQETGELHEVLDRPAPLHELRIAMCAQ